MIDKVPVIDYVMEDPEIRVELCPQPDGDFTLEIAVRSRRKPRVWKISRWPKVKGRPVRELVASAVTAGGALAEVLCSEFMDTYDPGEVAARTGGLCNALFTRLEMEGHI